MSSGLLGGGRTASSYGVRGRRGQRGCPQQVRGRACGTPRTHTAAAHARRTAARSPRCSSGLDLYPPAVARARTLVLVPVLAGVFVTVVMASDRGADSTVIGAQRAAGPLTAGKLEAFLRRGPTGKGAPKAPTRATCRPGNEGQLRNPWSCTLLYRTGERITYRVDVYRNG